MLQTLMMSRAAAESDPDESDPQDSDPEESDPQDSDPEDTDPQDFDGMWDDWCGDVVAVCGDEDGCAGVEGVCTSGWSEGCPCE
jgi:hypothetical protein